MRQQIANGRRRLLGAWFVLIVLVVGTAPAQAAEAGADLPRDEYVAFFMRGTRAGAGRLKIRQEGDEIVSDQRMAVAMRRFGVDVVVKSKKTFRERLDGTPVSFVQEEVTGAVEVRTEGKIEDGKLHLVSVQGEQRQERTVEWDEETLFPYAFDRRKRSLELKPGVEMTVKVFDPDVSLAKPDVVTLKVIGPGTVDVLGITHEATKIESRSAASPNTVEAIWVDRSGDELVTECAAVGIRIVRCTKEYALNKIEPLDLTESMMVKPDRPIQSPEQLERLGVRLSMSDGSPFAVQLPSEGHQRVVERTAESVTLEISREPHETPVENLKPYLARSRYLDCKDERIVEAAREAVGDETDPLRKAQRLRRAVHELVTQKDFGVALATASEVIETRQGDCSEHAVLLAAMARAQDIPSRVANGLIYLQGRFFFHLWTQVYVDGAWHDLDATLAGRDSDVTHIGLSTSAFDDEGSLPDSTAFLLLLGKLKIEIVE